MKLSCVDYRSVPNLPLWCLIQDISEWIVWYVFAFYPWWEDWNLVTCIGRNWFKFWHPICGFIRSETLKHLQKWYLHYLLSEVTTYSNWSNCVPSSVQVPKHLGNKTPSQVREQARTTKNTNEDILAQLFDEVAFEDSSDWRWRGTLLQPAHDHVGRDVDS